MEKKRLMILGLILYTSFAMCQEINWDNDFGWDYWDLYNDALKIKDHYYLTGSSTASGGLVLTKINNSGDTIWHKGFESTVGAMGINIKKNHRGNLMIFEHTTDNSGLLELDTNGNVLWMEEYNTSIDENNGSMVLLPNGDAIFMGDRGNYSTGPVYPFAIRTTHNGKVIWDKTYTSISNSTGMHISPLRNGGFILSGRSGLSGNNQIFQIQIDANGDTINSGLIYTGYSDHENFNSRIIEASDGGYFISGYVNVLLDTGFIIKTNSLFDVEWYKQEPRFYSKVMVELVDSSILLAGNGVGKGQLWKLDKNGGEIVNKTYQTLSLSNGSSFFGLEFNNDGSAIVVGSLDKSAPQYEDFYYARIDSLGKPIEINADCTPPVINELTAFWNGDTIALYDSSSVFLQYNQEIYKHWFFQSGQESFSDSIKLVFDQNQYPDTFWASLVISDGIYCTDTLTINVYNNEILENPNLGINEKVDVVSASAINISPNPANDNFTIQTYSTKPKQIQIYNTAGVLIQQLEGRNSMFKIQSQDYVSGIYLIRVLDQSGNVQTEKVLVR